MLGKDLSLKGVSYGAHGLPSLAPLDLEVAAGEHLALLEHGDGAAHTLLRLIAGFDRPDIGRVVVAGRDVTDLAPGERPSLLVGPDLGLFATVRVAETLDLAAHRPRPDRAERRARVAALLDRFDLADLADRRPDDLDAAAAVRLALARALAAEPALLLLDRPFLGVPVDRRPELRDLLDAVRDERGPTVIERCDDTREAFAHAGRVAAFVGRRLAQIDTPDRIWSAPASVAVARLAGGANVVPGRLVAREGALGRVETPIGTLRGTLLADVETGAAVTVTIRPERIDVVEWDVTPGRVINRFEADFIDRRLDGGSVRHRFAVGELRITLVRPDRGLHRLLMGGRTLLAVSAQDVWLHPAENGGAAGG